MSVCGMSWSTHKDVICIMVDKTFLNYIAMFISTIYGSSITRYFFKSSRFILKLWLREGKRHRKIRNLVCSFRTDCLNAVQESFFFFYERKTTSCAKYWASWWLLNSPFSCWFLFTVLGFFWNRNDLYQAYSGTLSRRIFVRLKAI